MSESLLKDFYKIDGSDYSETNQKSFKADVTLNKEHPVYKGHFEKVPVAPGVCVVQMLKEVLGHFVGKEFMMTQGQNIKFINMINPNEAYQFSITYSIEKVEGEIWTVSAAVANSAMTYLKFKGLYKEIGA